MIWRPVADGLASGLEEVRLAWSVGDLLEAHAALDARAEIEALVAEEAERDSAARRR